MAQSRKEELVEDLRQQRLNLSARGEDLKRQLKPAHLLQTSAQKHPLRWALSAGIVSFFITRALRPRVVVRSASRKRHGMVFSLARLAFKLARPTLTALAFQKGQQLLESRFNPPNENSRLGGSPQK